MQILFLPQAWLAAGLIFTLRVGDMTLDTMRMLMVMRGRKSFAWMLGFFQAAIFVLAITSVLRDISNPLSLIGYAAGFATGNVIGMVIEDKLAIGHSHLRIVSSRLGPAIAERLREEGYAVTEIPARGKDGMVTILISSVLRKNIGIVQRIIDEVDPEAFITTEEVRPIHRGFWRA